MTFISWRWQDIPDILIVAFIIYKVLLLFVGTRAMQLLRGVMLIGLFGALAKLLEFRTLSWVISHLLGAFIIVIPILFQPELRRILEELGKGRIISNYDAETMKKRSQQLVDAIIYCKLNKIGVLCVLQRNTGLKELWRTAVPLDADITNELLVSIFWEGTPLHDGAVVLTQEKIIAAGCYLPLSEKTDLSHWYGTRHRAAIGVTETSDAIALVVSEERGEVTVAVAGRLSKPLSDDQIKRICNHYFEQGGKDMGFMNRLYNEIHQPSAAEATEDE